MQLNPYQPPSDLRAAPDNRALTTPFRDAAMALFGVWVILVISGIVLQSPEIAPILEHGLQVASYLSLGGAIACMAIDRFWVRRVTWTGLRLLILILAFYLLPGVGIGALVFELTSSLPWAYIACLAVLVTIMVIGVVQGCD